MRVLQVQELGFHNRFTAGRCLTAVAEGLETAAGPLPAEIVAPLEDLSGEGLAAVLGGAELSLPSLAAALAVALQRLVYDAPWRGGAFRPDRGDFGVFLEYEDPQLARLCLSNGLRLAEELLGAARDADPARAAKLRTILAEHRRQQVGFAVQRNSREIVAEAAARGIPWARVSSASTHYALGQGHKLMRFHSMMCDRDPILGVEIAHNKLLADRLLARAGLPMSSSVPVASADAAVALARRLGYPVVIKPNSLLKGSGVCVDLTSEEEVRAAYATAAKFGAGVNIERMIPGDDHRILIVADRFVAAVRREPARVVGDGSSSVRELIAAENENPLRRDTPLNDLLAPIVPDAETDRLLGRQGLTLDSVPAVDQSVALKAIANIASGGTAIDVTDSIHPDNVAMAQRAARAADVEVAGVDYITTDISRSYRETGGKICEINTYVSLAPHRVAHPERGVIAPLVDRVFPPGEDGRIPVAVATGRGPCGAVVRSLAAILEAAGLTCGAATEQEVRIGGEVVARGNHATRRGAEIVLIDPACRSAALALDPADLAARGLAFDRCTVVAISGYAELEDAGREAVERLAGAAREAVVIEAGDAAALKMARALDGRRIVLVAGAGAKMPGKLPAGAALFHAEADSTGTLKLMLRDGKRREAVCPAPAADEDALSHALAAAAIAYAMGRPLETIAAGLAAMPESARRSAS